MIVNALGLTLWISYGLGQPLTDAAAVQKRFNEGLALYFSADYPAAIRAFEEVIKLDPTAAKAYYFLGYSYYEMKDPSKAREAFLQAYQLDPDYRPRSPASGSDQGRQP